MRSSTVLTCYVIAPNYYTLSILHQKVGRESFDQEDRELNEVKVKRISIQFALLTVHTDTSNLQYSSKSINELSRFRK